MQFILVKGPHFTLGFHGVSSSSVRLEHPTRSWRVVGSNPIWCSVFSEFPFDAKPYHVVIFQSQLLFYLADYTVSLFNLLVLVLLFLV